MNPKPLVSVFLAVLFFSAAGCATMESAGHKYIMRGQVLEVAGDEAYLCIGSEDGARVGQELAVYRFVKSPSPFGKPTQPYYKREAAGRVKITEIVDVHYAKARLLSGDVKANYIVELER